MTDLYRVPTVSEQADIETLATLKRQGAVEYKSAQDAAYADRMASLDHLLEQETTRRNLLEREVLRWVLERLDLLRSFQSGQLRAGEWFGRDAELDHWLMEAADQYRQRYLTRAPKTEMIPTGT